MFLQEIYSLVIDYQKMQTITSGQNTYWNAFKMFFDVF